MKKLGEGWQYTAYDLGNGRVLKRYHSSLKSYWVLLKTIFPFNNDPLWAIPHFSREMKEKAALSFKILREHDIPSDLIANPRFLNEFDFEQDKVVPLHTVFEVANLDEQKTLIDKFINFNLALLKCGVIDKSFNIMKNFGVSKEGALVLIDIGELVDTPSDIQHALDSRVWSKPYVAGCIKNAEARAYFLTQMEHLEF